MKRYTLYIYIVLLLLPLAVQAQVVVHARLDSTAILIGEQVHLSVNVSVDAGSAVRFPTYASGEVVKGVEMLEASAVDTAVINEGKRWELTRVYTLTSFDSALYSLPPVEIEVKGRKYHSPNAIGLKVNTVDIDTLHPDQYRDPHGVVEGMFEWNYRLFFLSLLVWLLMACSLVCLALRLRRRPMTRIIKLAPPTPPHERAIAMLRQIEPVNTTLEDDAKRYYVQLTDTLRTYINERFGFNAREMTTDEIISNLIARGDKDALTELKEILQTADLVKFAKYSADENDRALVRAVEYVNVTKLDIEPTKDQLYRVETIAQRKQDLIKLGYACASVLLAIAAVATAIYVYYELWQCFN